MKKEEQSKLTKFLNYITSKAFRDVVKNIFVTLLVIGVVVLIYFYIVDYGAKKFEESTGVNVLREVAGQANGNAQKIEIRLSEINVSTFSEQEKLKVMLKFSTQPDTVAFVKISGNGETINKSSSVMAGSHNFVLDLGDKSYNSLFVYSITVHDGAGNEKKIMGELRTPEKKNAKITIG